MPQRVICGGCGAVLFDSMELKPPITIIKNNNGRCPQCGKELVFDYKNIFISLAKKRTKRAVSPQ